MREHPKDKLGRLCAACGAPVRRHDTQCPRCGRALGVAPELNASLMTPFGWGLCGVLAGSIAGFALGTSLGLPSPFWLAALAALLGMFLASQIGKRLEPHLRCSYEHLLISCITGAIVLQFAMLVSPLPLETALLVWIMAIAAVYAGMRRWGYRMPA